MSSVSKNNILIDARWLNTVLPSNLRQIRPIKGMGFPFLFNRKTSASSGFPFKSLPSLKYKVELTVYKKFVSFFPLPIIDYFCRSLVYSRETFPSLPVEKKKSIKKSLEGWSYEPFRLRTVSKFRILRDQKARIIISRSRLILPLFRFTIHHFGFLRVKILAQAGGNKNEGWRD